MYLWLMDILMVTHTPRDWVGSRNRTMFLNVLFSKDIERLI